MICLAPMMLAGFQAGNNNLSVPDYPSLHWSVDGRGSFVVYLAK